MPLDPPPLRIESNLAPGGLVFQVTVDAMVVEEVRVDSSASEAQLHQLVEHQQIQLQAAELAGYDACVLVYDGGSGQLIHRVHLHREAEMPEGFASWSPEQVARHYGLG